MPKIYRTWDDFSDVEEKEGFVSAPLPPNGTYRYTIKSMKIKTNRSGDSMLSILFVLDDKTGKFTKHNGSACWWNGNLTKVGAGFVNRFLNAAGLGLHDLWTGRVLVSAEDNEVVTKIGSKAVEGLAVMISVKHGEDNKGNDRVNAVDFFPARSAKAQAEDDEYGDDDEDAEDADTDEDEDDDEPPF